MRLETFKAEDYYKLEQPPNRGLHLWIEEERIPENLMNIENMRTSRTLWEGDKIYAIFGVIEVRLGVLEAYFLPCKDWLSRKKSVCKYIKQDLDVLKKMFNRIQMACLEEEAFLRFAKFFGFEKEGSLKYFDIQGRTYAMLAITGGVTNE